MMTEEQREWQRRDELFGGLAMCLLAIPCGLSKDLALFCDASEELLRLEEQAL